MKIQAIMKELSTYASVWDIWKTADGYMEVVWCVFWPFIFLGIISCFRSPLV